MGPAAGNVSGSAENTDTAKDGLEGHGLSKRVIERLKKVGITSLFPVQAQTYLTLMDGKDIVVKSRTGSGKTIAFALPVIEKCLAANRTQRGRRPQTIILAPTRELAIQIHKEFVRIEYAPPPYPCYPACCTHRSRILSGSDEFSTHESPDLMRY